MHRVLAVVACRAHRCTVVQISGVLKARNPMYLIYILSLLYETQVRATIRSERI